MSRDVLRRHAASPLGDGGLIAGLFLWCKIRSGLANKYARSQLKVNMSSNSAFMRGEGTFSAERRETPSMKRFLKLHSSISPRESAENAALWPSRSIFARIQPDDLSIQSGSKRHPGSVRNKSVSGGSIDLARSRDVGNDGAFQSEHVCQGESWATLSEE